MGDRGLVGDFIELRRDEVLLLYWGIDNGDGACGGRAAVGGFEVDSGGGAAETDCVRPTFNCSGEPPATFADRVLPKFN